MNNKQLADKITTELTGYLQYVVTDDVQWFDKNTKLGDESYVPVVLTVVATFENENRYVRNETYHLQFRVKRDQRDPFYADMDAFKASQTTEAIDTYFVTKVVEKPVKGETNTIRGVEYIDYTVEMRWTWALSRVGTSTVIKVDNVDIPFITCDVAHDKVYVSNQAQSSGYRLTTDTVILTVPLIVANTKVADLYASVNDNEYNRVYELSIDGNVKNVVLKRGQYIFANTATVTQMILTFETHYPRVMITLDGDVLPVTAYFFSGKKIFDMAPRTNDIQRGYATSKIRTWSITFVINDTDVMAKLYNDAYGNVVGVTYTLDVGLAQTYKVELGEINERYTETGDMALECQFIEV